VRHANQAGVWLACFKKETGKPRVSYEEAVEEAVCFGWIDGCPLPMDEERYTQQFRPRKAGSAWTAVNRERADRLTVEGRMSAAGLAVVDAAKLDGSWEVYEATEAQQLVDDVAAALAGKPAARETYEGYPAWLKRDIVWWIECAKKPEARDRRLREAVENAAAGEIVRHSRPACG
jgi:uncharacterized protein YdeI (YjbR/CyaY-like superfamily)